MRDVITMGSVSVVRALMAADLIDGYQAADLPAVLGTGERLFPAVLTRYRTAAR